MTDFGVMLTWLLSFATLIGDALIAVVLVSMIAVPRSTRRMISFVGKHALFVAFLVATVSTVGSLSYSNVVGFEVCHLCWYQRMFMYPLVLILGYAVYKKDRNELRYATLLCIVGAALSFVHWALQMAQIYGGVPVPCSIAGLTPICTSAYVLEFGYVTIPMMSLTAFALILLTIRNSRLN